MNVNKAFNVVDNAASIGNLSFDNIDSLLSHTNTVLDKNHKLYKIAKDELGSIIKVVGFCANATVVLFLILLFVALFIL